MSKKNQNPALLFEGSDWDFDILKSTYDAIEDIALNELKLDVYANQVEVITSEQMLDAYSSIGMPLMYHHWSFGKRFVRDDVMYRKGYQGLAYEIVINSNPCISYIMEENGMVMQALVMAHAAFGHNHFFKNNYLFKQWTDAEGILDYLQFAKRYIAQCEDRFGFDAVERIIDAAHALMDQGVNRYSHPEKPDWQQEAQRDRDRARYEDETYNDLWRTLPQAGTDAEDADETRRRLRAEERRAKLGLPEENLLYFLEKNAPGLGNWEREIVRIVRNIGQYFYPQKQTKVMNEGCACYVHYHIMNALYDRGQITEGAMMEFIDYHSRVVFQADFDDRRYSGFNPYALGFAMMQDIHRICVDPTDEDRHWFPDMAGNNRPYDTLKDAWAHYRDESFILQYLSPKLMRDMKMFMIDDAASSPHLEVAAIHDDAGYRKVRRTLARMHDISVREPDLQVVDVDLNGNRQLIIQHTQHDGIRLEKSEAEMTLGYIGRLWGYGVTLQAVDNESGEILHEMHYQPDDSQVA
ncbi:SpoVR family protein [Thalassospira sp.]|uniref:SpoVR family protein n=1 Tax=Thalassospira sp. TaxID=1912094 RepID=UPI002732D04E|nr:SpoVR family protein [Thalassospira sp.]MDP2697382.1 SpoVR family protein [Thalassospira sp.]